MCWLFGYAFVLAASSHGASQHPNTSVTMSLAFKQKACILFATPQKRRCSAAGVLHTSDCAHTHISTRSALLHLLLWFTLLILQQESPDADAHVANGCKHLVSAHLAGSAVQHQSVAVPQDEEVGVSSLLRNNTRGSSGVVCV